MRELTTYEEMDLRITIKASEDGLLITADMGGHVSLTKKQLEFLVRKIKKEYGPLFGGEPIKIPHKKCTCPSAVS